jgi:hypothetical protein
MTLRISIFVVCLVLHLLTPSWYLSDFLKVADWVMLLFSAIDILLYKLNLGIRKSASFYLSINSLLYFISTTQKMYPDVGVNYFSTRLGVIFKTKNIFPEGVLRFVEVVNIIQILLGILIVIYLVFKLYVSKKT